MEDKLDIRKTDNLETLDKKWRIAIFYEANDTLTKELVMSVII